jgi:hypothetical protein
MAPGWSLKDPDGAEVPAPPPPPPDGPPTTGLVWWNKDSTLNTSGGDATSWENAVDPSFNVDPIIFTPPGSFVLPTVGDPLDGIDGIIFSTDSSNQYQSLLGNPAVSWKDRNGTLFGFGAGETQTRTTFHIARGVYSPESFGVIGGCLLRFGTTATGGFQDFEVFFRLQDLPAHSNSWALWANNWPNGFANALFGPDTAGGAGGPYSGVPIAVACTFDGTDINLYVNDGVTPIVLTPGNAIPAPDAGHPVMDFAAYAGVNQAASVFDRWFGTRYEDLIFDWDVSSSPDDWAQLWTYADTRFPSIGIVVP